jgi:hypothetical protein
MCNRRARAGRAKQLGFPGRKALAGLSALLVTAAGAASLGACSPSGSQTPEMWAVAQRQAEPAAGADPQALSAALLSRADMGSNFSLLPAPPGSTAAAGNGSGTRAGSGAASVTGCPQLGVLGSVGATLAQDDQGVTYRPAGGTPLVAESLRTAPGAALAAEYAEDRAALTTCRGLSIKVQGIDLSVMLTQVGLGEVRSATAVRLDGILEGVQVDGYLVLDDVGPAELAYLFLQVGTGSPQLATYYFEQADGKARRYFDTVWSSWHGPSAFAPGGFAAQESASSAAGSGPAGGSGNMASARSSNPLIRLRSSTTPATATTAVTPSPASAAVEPNAPAAFPNP